MSEPKLLSEIELFEHPLPEPGFEPVPERVLFHITHGRCYYCGIILSPDICTTDHVIPSSLGGNNSSENFVPACNLCNSTKGTRDVEVFRLVLWERRVCEQFTQRQIDWLARYKIELPVYGRFWGERLGYFLPLVQYIPRVKKPVDLELGRFGNLRPK